MFLEFIIRPFQKTLSHTQDGMFHTCTGLFQDSQSTHMNLSFFFFCTRSHRIKNKNAHGSYTLILKLLFHYSPAQSWREFHGLLRLIILTNFRFYVIQMQQPGVSHHNLKDAARSPELL